MALHELVYAAGVISPPSTASEMDGPYLVSWMHDLVSELAPLPPQVDDTWTDQFVGILPAQQSQQPSTLATNDVEEDMGIRLVHALLTCADALQRGELPLAASLIDEMTNCLLTRVNTACGIGKVAGCFVEALSRRLYQPPGLEAGPVPEHEALYLGFYEACPYLKFAHFTANQAILEAFDGCDHVHVIDFSLMHGSQWPALIQALALRPGGPPSLRLTAIGLPSGKAPLDSLREAGLRLAQLARSVNVRLAFRAIAASRLEDIKPWVLEADPREAVAVNSVLQLHRFLATDTDSSSALRWVRSLNPKVVTVVEHESDHNRPEFLARFTEALYYYSAMFDSLEACQLEPERALAELYMQGEIANIVCCEGAARVERHEPLAKWRARMARAGFEPLALGHSAFRQASMLLTLCSSEGYSVQESEGCLSLDWHSRPLFAASAWQVGRDASDGPSPIHDGTSSSSTSS